MIDITPEEILLTDLETGVKLRLPTADCRLPTAVHRYLALQTDFDVQAWELSPAKFADKWRLAFRIMEGIVQDKDVIYVLNGGTLYPIGGKDPVFCSKCFHEMSQVGDTWLCRHCAHDV